LCDIKVYFYINMLIIIGPCQVVLTGVVDKYSNSIIQDIVTDCSFVASLCVTAAYECKFKKQVSLKGIRLTPSLTFVTS
jgi:hypothetical protein